MRIFDGKSTGLTTGLRVVVEGQKIKSMEPDEKPIGAGFQIIDCGGRVMMPGLIDAHWHSMFAALPVSALLSADIGYIFLAAGAEAERTLMRGFTTIRDLGGPSFALKQAIDDGFAAGPRIYPSGAMITTTGGHADLRPLSDLPRSPGAPLSYVERTGAANIADSADEVRLRVREQLLQGASQIKLVGGGGVSSPRTTLDMLTFTEPEFRAGVEAAADRNTYVTVHAYPPVAIRRAIAAGAQCIEHGHLMDEATATLMAEKGIWLSTQPFVADDDASPLTKGCVLFACTAMKMAVAWSIKCPCSMHLAPAAIDFRSPQPDRRGQQRRCSDRPPRRYPAVAIRRAIAAGAGVHRAWAFDGPGHRRPGEKKAYVVRSPSSAGRYRRR